ncbi:predicted protein, partial [Naegleria gruberi]
NNPLFLKVYKTAEAEEPLKYHYIAHTALDIVEEKISNRKTTTNVSQNDMYLGLLFPTEIYKVYGYITNSDVKLLLIIAGDEYQQSDRDSEIKSLFQQLHSLYIDCICNPFYTFGEKIDSLNFAVSVRNLVQNYNQQQGVGSSRKSKKF